MKSDTRKTSRKRTFEINPLDVHIIPPKEVDTKPFEHIFLEYLKNHPDCTKIKIRKNVPQDVTGLVVDFGLNSPLSDDIFDRYKVVAKELANLTKQKITLIPTEIGVEAMPESE